MAMSSICGKFQPNFFNKTKCQNCFRSKEAHSVDALENNNTCRKISKCGYLFVAPEGFNGKSDRTRRWQRRFFVLYDDGELTYSVDENVTTVPQGELDMSCVIDVHDAEIATGHQYCIAIRTSLSSLFVKACSKEEVNRWYDVLSMYVRSVQSKHRRHNSFRSSQQNGRTTDWHNLVNEKYSQIRAEFNHKMKEDGSKAGCTQQECTFDDVDGVATRAEPLTYRGMRSLKQKHTGPMRRSSSIPDLNTNSLPVTPLFRSNSGENLDKRSGTYFESCRDLPSRKLYKHIAGIPDAKSIDNYFGSNGWFRARTAVRSNITGLSKFAWRSRSQSPRRSAAATRAEEQLHSLDNRAFWSHEKESNGSDNQRFDDKSARTGRLSSGRMPERSVRLQARFSSLQDRAQDVSSAADNVSSIQDRSIHERSSSIDSNSSIQDRSSRILDRSSRIRGRTSSIPDRSQRIPDRTPSLPSRISTSTVPTFEISSTDSDRSSPQEALMRMEKVLPTVDSSRFGLNQNETDESKINKSDEVKARLSRQMVRPSGGKFDKDDIMYMKKGWLHKLDEQTSQWQKLWFVLKGMQVRYFSDSQADDSDQAMGAIQMTSCYTISEVDVNRNYGILLKTHDGQHTLSAMTLGIRTNWIQALDRCMQRVAAVTACPSVPPVPVMPLSPPESVAETERCSSPSSSSSSSSRWDSKSSDSVIEVKGNGDDKPRYTSCTWPYQGLSRPETPVERSNGKLNEKKEKFHGEVGIVRPRWKASTGDQALVELLETEVDSLKSQLEQARTEQSLARQDNLELRAQIQASRLHGRDSDTDCESSHYLLQIEDIQEQMEHTTDLLHNRLAESQSQTKHNRTIVQTLRCRLKDAEDKICILEKEISGLKQKLEASHSELNTTEQALTQSAKDLTTEREKYKQQQDNWEAGHSQLELHNSHLDRQYKEVQEELEDAAEQLLSKQAEVDRISRRNEMLEKEAKGNERLQRQMESQLKRSESLERELSLFKLRLRDNAEQLKNEQEKHLEELREVQAQADAEIRDIQEEVRDIDIKLQNSLLENRNMNEVVGNNESNLRRVSEEMFEKDIELNDIKEKLREKEKLFAVSKSELRDLETKLKNAQNDLKICMAKNALLEANFKKSNEELIGKVKILTEQLNKQDEKENLGKNGVISEENNNSVESYERRELKRVRVELHEAQCSIDKMELEEQGMQLQFCSMQEDYQNQLQLMGARLEDLTGKLAASERKARKLERRASKSRRKSRTSDLELEMELNKDSCREELIRSPVLSPEEESNNGDGSSPNGVRAMLELRHSFAMSEQRSEWLQQKVIDQNILQGKLDHSQSLCTTLTEQNAAYVKQLDQLVDGDLTALDQLVELQTKLSRYENLLKEIKRHVQLSSVADDKLLEMLDSNFTCEMDDQVERLAWFNERLLVEARILTEMSSQIEKESLNNIDGYQQKLLALEQANFHLSELSRKLGHDLTTVTGKDIQNDCHLQLSLITDLSKLEISELLLHGELDSLIPFNSISSRCVSHASLESHLRNIKNLVTQQIPEEEKQKLIDGQLQSHLKLLKNQAVMVESQINSLMSEMEEKAQVQHCDSSKLAAEELKTLISQNSKLYMESVGRPRAIESSLHDCKGSVITRKTELISLSVSTLVTKLMDKKPLISEEKERRVLADIMAEKALLDGLLNYLEEWLFEAGEHGVVAEQVGKAESKPEIVSLIQDQVASYGKLSTTDRSNVDKQALANKFTQSGHLGCAQFVKYEAFYQARLIYTCLCLQQVWTNRLKGVTDDKLGARIGELEAELRQSEEKHKKELKRCKEDTKLAMKAIRQANSKASPGENSEENSVLNSKVHKLEKQMLNMQTDYETELAAQKQAHRREMCRSKDEMLEMLAVSEAEESKCDEKSISSRYVSEMARIKDLYERGFAAMERSHRRVTASLRQAHKNEYEMLRQEKEQLLAEETKATQAALDAMRKAHEAELQKERSKYLDAITKTYSAQDVACMEKQQEEDLEIIQLEIQQLSEQYGVKCAENASLEDRYMRQSRALLESRRRLHQQQVEHQDMYDKIKEELNKLRKGMEEHKFNVETEQTVANKLTELDAQHLKEEMKLVKEQYQAKVKELEDVCMDKDRLLSEMNLTKKHYENEVEHIRLQLDQALTNAPIVSNAATPSKTRKTLWRQKEPQRAQSSPSLSQNVTFSFQENLGKSLALPHVAEGF